MVRLWGIVAGNQPIVTLTLGMMKMKKKKTSIIL